jgi:hypothetical protein
LDAVGENQPVDNTEFSAIISMNRAKWAIGGSSLKIQKSGHQPLARNSADAFIGTMVLTQHGATPFRPGLKS